MNNEMTTEKFMSNEEVIKVLKGIVFDGFDRTTLKERQALAVAIMTLEDWHKLKLICANEEIFVYKVRGEEE